MTSVEGAVALGKGATERRVVSQIRSPSIELLLHYFPTLPYYTLVLGVVKSLAVP